MAPLSQNGSRNQSTRSGRSPLRALSIRRTDKASMRNRSDVETIPTSTQHEPCPKPSPKPKGGPFLRPTVPSTADSQRANSPEPNIRLLSSSPPDPDNAPAKNTNLWPSHSRGESHGLSWSNAPATRDSLVDTLLSSLDQIPSLQPDPGHNYSQDTYDAATAASPPRHIPMNRINQYRSRSHAHSSSISSDHERPPTSDSTTTTSTHTRRPSNLGVARLPAGMRKGSSSSQNHTDTYAQSRSFSRSGSKSSEMMAADNAYASSPQSKSYARATSRDRQALFGTNDPFRPSESLEENPSSESILARGRPIPSLHSSFGTSAPEPLVPSGPGAVKEVSEPSKATSNVLSANPARPRNNLRTPSANTRSSMVRSPPASPKIPQDVRDQASDFVRANGGRNTHNALSTTSSNSTTAPPGSTNKYSASPTEEKKTGFFKRVFGSSTSRSNLSEASSVQPSPATSRQGSHSNIATSTKYEQRKSRFEPLSTPSEPSQPTPQPVLNKKSSSFFRRRKKSIDNSKPPPALPKLIQGPPESPSAGSLYKAMDPYIGGDQVATPTRMVAREATYAPRPSKRDESSPSTGEDSEDPDIFHSGYTPPPDASINKLTPLGHNPATFDPDFRRPSVAPSTAFSVRSDLPLRSANNSRPASPDSRMKLRKKDKPPTLQSNFLRIDDSDSDIKASDSVPVSGTDAVSAAHDCRDPVSPKMEYREKPDLAINTSSPTIHNEDFVVSKGHKGAIETTRVWLEPSPIEGPETFVTPNEANPDKTFLAPQGASPIEAHMSPRISSVDDLGLTYHSATSLHEVQDTVEPTRSLSVQGYGERHGSDATRSFSVATMNTMPVTVEDDRERAQQIFDGKDILVMQGQACAWLGENKPTSIKTLKHFMGLFNFRGHTILAGMRMLCQTLTLKGESQQVDRVLDAFAARWCESNPNHGFKIKDVVHTICYSLLLLNTDLHMADIDTKMSRAQFVKNTLPTIKRVVADAPVNDETIKPTQAAQRPGLPWQDSQNSITSDSGPLGPMQNENDVGRKMSMDSRRPTLTKRLSWTLGMFPKDDESTGDMASPANSGSNALVKDGFDGKPAEWHYELESVLKSFFTAIKSEPLPLTRSEPEKNANNFHGPPGTLRRAGSIKSMAPSEMSMRSKKTDFHSMSSRWGKKGIRSKFYASSTMASSRTSFDDGSSMFSPAGSSAWSKYSMGNKTLTTMSSDSLGGHYADQGFQQSIGFANALSQSNARDDGTTEDDNVSYNPQKFLLEDETLELAGAPWAKEGMVKHKHHLEASEKKAKERNWSESFAVIEKGYLRLFSFNSKGGKTGSLGVRKHVPKGKAASIAPSVVGGGNWMANAEQLGSFLLRQTIASTLPPPGYSKARPHVWALSLPSGAVHLFQVGTAEIATEFMNTANYWSARLSKEPLTGGVDNIEYGWGENIVNPALLNAINTSSNSPEVPSLPPSRHGASHSASNSLSMPRPSIASSMRGSIDLSSSTKARLPGDKAHLEDWTPPVQSMMASQLMEVDQLSALKNYVENIEGEFARHNDLRTALTLAYSPKHANHTKSIQNWEKKSAYLLREIVKFTTYIQALDYATKQKEIIDAERADREKEKEEREARKRARLEAEALARGETVSLSLTVTGTGEDGVGSGEKKVSIEV